MKQTVISVGSVTFGLKGRDLLRRSGYSVRLERMSSGPGSAGCGYALMLNGDVRGAQEILQNAGVKILGVEEL